MGMYSSRYVSSCCRSRPQSWSIRTVGNRFWCNKCLVIMGRVHFWLSPPPADVLSQAAFLTLEHEDHQLTLKTRYHTIITIFGHVIYNIKHWEHVFKHFNILIIELKLYVTRDTIRTRTVFLLKFTILVWYFSLKQTSKSHIFFLFILKEGLPPAQDSSHVSFSINISIISVLKEELL